MPATLDTRRIRTSTPAELRDYYNELLKNTTIESITAQLLQAIEIGSIPPLTFAPWLGVSKSPATIRGALRQNKSVLVRKIAIKQLRNALSPSAWKTTWDGIGGTAGLLEIFADLSVLEVREACKAIGRYGKCKEMVEKRRCVTEFFKGLHPDDFPDTSYKTTDRRALSRYYRLIIPMCSEGLIDQAVADGLSGPWKNAREKDLLRYHSNSIQKELLRSLATIQTQPVDQHKLEVLLQQYPSTESMLRGFSASMEFSLTVLRTLGQSEAKVVDDDFFINQLVRPLLKRVIKKRVQWNTLQEIIDLILHYLEAHPSARRKISTEVGDVLHLVAMCWSRKPDLFEKQLRKLCSHIISGTSNIEELRNWGEFLSGIRTSRCYALFRLCYQASTHLDIGNDADLKLAKGPLSQDLLTKLGPEQALLLFTRLRSMKGDEDLVALDTGNSVLNSTASYGGRSGDPELYYMYLLTLNGRHEEAEVLATGYVEDRTKRAASASQPEQRTYYAKSVLYAAIACESLDMLKETLDWTKHFMRDPLVIRELYPQSYHREMIRLLTGIPERLTSPPDLRILRQRVEKGNSILVGMFDTTCAALREPSFSARHWEGVFNLFYAIVQKRVDLTPKLKARLNASDDEMYHCLWEPTIPMLVDVEEKANMDGHEQLFVNGLRGILDCGNGPCYIDLVITEMSTSTFIDKLAQARDELWRRLRTTVYPATATLPEIFPRGLPIQYLTSPWFPNVQDLDRMFPYLASRVQTALFPEPTAALQAVSLDNDSRKYIGYFVDSYQHALQLYIRSSCEKGERRKRAEKTWDYAMNSLSQNRMTREEAARFWQTLKPDCLKEWPPQKFVGAGHASWPVIPESNDPLEPLEWNPFASGRPESVARDLNESTYLDLSTIVLEPIRTNEFLFCNNPTIRDRLRLPSPKVPAYEARKGSIWSASRNMGEGGVLSALLYLDAKYVSTDHLLRTPFPSEAEPRYPPLYLEDEFLSSEDLNPYTAARNIRGHLDAIPPALLAHLAQKLIAALDAADEDASTYTGLHSLAMLIIVRFSESDRPVLATQLAIRTILERPKSSSWHRQLLKPSFLRRLSALDAQACVETFAERIFDTLRAKRLAEETKLGEDGESSNDQPFVKVTTVKLLAQLMQETGLVGKDHAISMLSKLAQNTNHVDVRLNVVKGLLGMLDSSSEHANDVRSVLEPMVPLAGVLYERQPLTEAKWVEIEKSLDLPVLQLGLVHELEGDSPFLSTLINHISNSSCEAYELQPFVDRIIIPTLECLKQQTARWVALFLRKYGVDEAAQKELQIPAVPRDPSVTQLVLSVQDSRLSCLPRTVLEEFVGRITFNIAPPAPIRALNKRLREDSALSSRSEVQVWLRLYGQGIEAVKSLGSFNFISLLKYATDSSDDTRITPRLIQEQFLKLFTVVLWNDKPSYMYVKGFVAREMVSGRNLAEPWWQPHGKSILEAMISHVNSIRTRDWERDSNRTPSVLPDTFPWRLLLLDYPWPELNDKSADRDAKCKLFARQLTSIIDELIGSRVYHNNLSALETYLTTDVVSFPGDQRVSKRVGKLKMHYVKRNPLRDALMDNRILAAVYLGDITQTRLSWVTGAEELRAEVAGYLVKLVGKDIKELNGDMRESLRGLAGFWKGCDNEGVRRLGWEVEGKYFLDG
ncbi:hypothetical protein EJ02DRAFT_473066 [Clathrospora elynae]|uniref:Uncharacterized protein n=1 Tax=Clathrospora elynae TaxID=706981 RepID=A0A6A5SJN8_9PLEO|nr:hypothetical protein EJ02DRAFT_473066 [Clathrospora elynae]